MGMAYLSFLQAFTYRNATAKKTTVNTSMVRSCMAVSPSFESWEPWGGLRWTRFSEFRRRKRGRNL
jgi:hypothetical protein